MVVSPGAGASAGMPPVKQSYRQQAICYPEDRAASYSACKNPG